MRAVNRIFSILDAFTADRTKLALQEIGDRIQLSKATTFRLVNSLCGAGYLVKLEDQRYCLSMKLVKLAGVVASGLSVRDMARPTMVEIGRKTGETVSLNAVVGTDRVCIDVVEAESRLTHIVNLGEHAPLFYGATGKVLLAHLPPDEQSAIISALPADFSMESAELKARLAQIRKSYYAVTKSERVAGSLAISVALFDMDDRGMYALTLTGPEERMRDEQECNLALMLQAQKEISLKMGAGLFSAAVCD
ncbi:IclR family transcriptional regulator [Pollutimonas nitritireducens]|uniref:IclR family transcriptional regulator n=1 Tax=Pollutimonas nitritireducens TaxID=2045209 RepID=UPI0013042BA8|nr:IclR family transcriptional regulator [Pollutimonas nitritireducens]